jgi:hypothetical protein
MAMILDIGLRWLSIWFGAMGFLQGCAQFAPQAPGEPTADQLVQFNAELAKLPTTDRAALVSLGYALSDDQCDQFFIALQIARNKNSYDAAELSALTALVTPSMTALDVGAKAVGITGRGVGLRHRNFFELCEIYFANRIQHRVAGLGSQRQKLFIKST